MFAFDQIPNADQVVTPNFDSVTDPLLKSSDVINGNITSGETVTGDDNTVGENHVERDSAESAEKSNGVPAVAAEDLDNVEYEAPYPINYALPAKIPTRRGRMKKSDVVVEKEKKEVSVDSPTPDWLPSGWTIEDRVRLSGASAGSRDKYYFDPVSHKKFRSRKEVIHFLETGNKRKKTEESSGKSKQKESPGKSKQKESPGKSKQKESTGKSKKKKIG